MAISSCSSPFSFAYASASGSTATAFASTSESGSSNLIDLGSSSNSVDLGSSSHSVDLGTSSTSGSGDSFMDSLWDKCNSYGSSGSSGGLINLPESKNSSPIPSSPPSTTPIGSTGSSGGIDFDALRRKGEEAYFGRGGNPNPVQDTPQTQAPRAPRLNATVDPRLQGAVDQIAQDPVGARLIEGANARGLRSVDVQDLGDGIMGMYWPDQNRLAISPQTANGPDLVRTLAHELLHAATPEGGDSQREEGLADRIGIEIQQRLTGLGPGYTLDTAGYNHLPLDNGIVQSLRNIGIIV